MGRGWARSAKGASAWFWLSVRPLSLTSLLLPASQEALARVVFNVAPTCIDVNQHTMSSSQIDVLVGFSNGDVFWFGALGAHVQRASQDHH